MSKHRPVAPVQLVSQVMDPDFYDFAELQWERDKRLYTGDGTPEGELAGFRAWCEDHVMIQHPEGKRPFVMRPEQVSTAKSYIEDGKVLILKARQIGFTTLTMNFCLWRALFFSDFSVIVLSKKEDDAKAALIMCKTAYQELDLDIKQRLPQRLDNAASRMTFDNDSWIESHPAANNPARGRTATLMILDEWAFMPNPDDAWASVSPAADIGGRIIALSTANGWGNTFHSMWIKATTGDNNFTDVFHPWWAVPERDPRPVPDGLVGDGLREWRETADWYEMQRRDMLPWQLAQEFPGDAEEAFIKSGNPVFDIDLLRGIQCDDPLMGELRGEDLRGRSFAPVPGNGPLSVYEMPEAGKAYVLGVDVAQGLEHGDYSSMHVIRVDTGSVTAVWHGKMDPDLLGYEVAALGYWYKTGLIGVEINNHGLTTAKTLQRVGYPALYYRRRLGSRKETLSEELGWMTTKSSKPLIIDGLQAALRNDLQLFDQPTVAELMQYQRKADGSTEGSPHDDRVISLAIANEMRRWHREAAEQIVRKAPVGSIAWEMEQFEIREREAQQQGLVLGGGNIRNVGRFGQ